MKKLNVKRISGSENFRREQPHHVPPNYCGFGDAEIDCEILVVSFI